jgi:argininosuccinate synthase
LKRRISWVNIGIDKLKNIVNLEKLANAYAIGRDTVVDAIIGIKGRVGFEAAAPQSSLKHTIY